MKKEAGKPKPWSDDPVFQTVYFCNVHRENDRVTRWIRDFYSPYVNHPNFVYNLILARMINWPQTLNAIGYVEEHNPDLVYEGLALAEKQQSKIWGGAYIITTHGLPMPKQQYLVDHVLTAAQGALGAYGMGVPLHGPRPLTGQPITCQRIHEMLMSIEGLGSFLAAQVVADIKYTPNSFLSAAHDWWTFVAPGPGSLRGLSWFRYGEIGKVTPAYFLGHFLNVRSYVDENLNLSVPQFCNQDLQNCLCEFDKYMRVSRGTGRSKRNYNGH